MELSYSATTINMASLVVTLLKALCIIIIIPSTPQTQLSLATQKLPLESSRVPNPADVQVPVKKNGTLSAHPPGYFTSSLDDF